MNSYQNNYRFILFSLFLYNYFIFKNLSFCTEEEVQIPIDILFYDTPDF